MTKSPFIQALSELVNSMRRYLDIRLNILKLEIMEKSSRIVALTIASVFLLMLFMLFLLFVSLSAAIYAGELLESSTLGYLCVAGFYFLLSLLFFIFRRRLFLGIVIRHMSEIFFEDKKADDDDED
jgi:cellulose synthase/poly-beta-1,6-N-acetylglucosamine synthase-like glycosyltransferase